MELLLLQARGAEGEDEAPHGAGAVMARLLFDEFHPVVMVLACLLRAMVERGVLGGVLLLAGSSSSSETDEVDVVDRVDDAADAARNSNGGRKKLSYREVVHAAADVDRVDDADANAARNSNGGRKKLSYREVVHAADAVVETDEVDADEAYADNDNVHVAKRFPPGWETYDYQDIRSHFDCNRHSNDNSKPLPTLEEWNRLRTKFAEIVDPSKDWDDDPVPPTMGYSLDPNVPYPPPYYAKFSPGRGRGLFASRSIREGEVVHDGTHSDVVFPNAVEWRRYVFSLPRNLACDCTDWHWMQRLEEGGEHFLVAGINISSLMNSGGAEYGSGREANAMPESPYSGRFLATRYIEEGEEILTDYYAYDTDWSIVGL